MKNRVKKEIMIVTIVLFILLIVQVIYKIPNYFMEFIVWLGGE